MTRAKVILSDLKLLAAGIGIGALICASWLGHPADHACGTVAAIAAGTALALRVAEGRYA